jgi:predicted TIM-barrel fold metal-dependent hydrolase
MTGHWSTWPEPWTSEAVRDPRDYAPLAFEVPEGACDSHMHVFGPTDKYKGVPEARYTAPKSDVDTYLATADALHLQRMVFTQASFYATDNSYLLHALECVGNRGRAVVMLPANADTKMIDDFTHRGVVGLRLDLFKMAKMGFSSADVFVEVMKAAKIAKSAGWHVEIYSPGPYIRDLMDRFGDIPVEFSINHMGYMTRADVPEEDFVRFTRAIRNERCWVKLCGSYRISKYDNDTTADDMAKALVAACPDRLVWGSDWPHIPICSLDTSALLNKLADWAPDDAARKKILSDNPARLYGF